MARRCGLALVVALLASLVEQSMQLRTGVAPTYIPTMRQMTSYEKSMINTMNELVRYIRTRETEQVALFNTREAEQSGRDVEKIIRDNKKAEAARKRADNYQIRAQHAAEQHGTFQQTVINNGKEPQKVHLEAVKAAQQAYVYQTQQTNSHLNAYATAIKAQNEVLEAEKQALWLSLDEERRGELFEFENSMAVEAQRSKEERLKEIYNVNTTRYRAMVSDMKTRNAGQAATVPGLTAARDGHEATKLDDEIMYADHELQADAAQKTTESLEALNADLQTLINRYNQANTDMKALNTLIKSEVATITAERDALRNSADQARINREYANTEAENHEVNVRDVQQQRERLWQEFNSIKRHDDPTLCPNWIPSVKAERDALVAQNKDLISKCF